jgi:hypothetical protein
MPDYRLYFYDDQYRIRFVMTLECADDQEAIQSAEKHRDGRALEVWCRTRLVKRFEADIPR